MMISTRAGSRLKLNRLITNRLKTVARGFRGWRMGPDTLAYVLGGYGQVNANAALRLGDDTLSTDQTFDVWTVGAGIEHRITNMVSLKLEYRHMFYDGKTYDLGDDVSLEVKPSEDIGLVGISWRIQ